MFTKWIYGLSRLLGSNSSLAEETETLLATVCNAEKPLIFNSGYIPRASLAVLSCIPQKGDVIIYDELIHACLHDDARLSKVPSVLVLNITI